MSTNLVLVVCTISRGPFSGERCFRLALYDGTPYSGLAPADYCFGTDMKPINPEKLVGGEEHPGFVQANLVRTLGETAVVEFPNGEAQTIHISLVTPITGA